MPSLQNEVIIRSINLGLSREEVIATLAETYVDDKDDNWARRRVSKFESAYGFMGFFANEKKDCL